MAISHKANLARYVGGGDFSVLKERIQIKIEQFYEEQKGSISTTFPVDLLVSNLQGSQLDLGTKLTLKTIAIDVQ